MKKIIENKYKIKVIIGIILILLGSITNITWFYIGIIPLMVGITKFCPACYFLKRCSLKR